jgi:acetyl-CoA C-acetyltransferase
MQDVYIVSAVRTPVGRFGGALKDVKPSDLGSLVISESLKRIDLEPQNIDEIILGVAFPSGEQGGNPARTAAVKAGISIETPAFTVNENCISGLRTVALAANKIASGEANIVVAGGMENMSQVPYISTSVRWGPRLGHAELLDYLRVAMFDPLCNLSMGETAEKLADHYSISRKEQDEWAFMSQKRAEIAISKGLLEDEIVPVIIPTKKGTKEFVQDEHPNFGTTMKDLAALRPVFYKDGSVTAGNSSGLNDAGAALVLMSGEKVKKRGVQPLAKVIASSFVGVEPEIMGIAPVFATRKIMSRTGLDIDQFDLIECNEAFAAQIISVERELHWDRNKVNVNGGAIAFGHPIGASGPRLLITLCYELKRRKKKYGLATLCCGGGLGGALIVENVV